MKHPLRERLTAEIRSGIDELIARDAKIGAINLLMKSQSRPSIPECQDLLLERYAELNEPWFRPSPPLIVEELVEQIAALPHPSCAIEAFGMAIPMVGLSVWKL